MRLRQGPLAATSLLQYFCPDSEYNTVIGDLTEQYQRGHGPFWYWKQVLFIVFLGSYRDAVPQPWVAADRIPIGAGFGLGTGVVTLVLVAVGIFFALETELPLLLPPIIGGPIAFALIRRRNSARPVPLPFAGPATIQINTTRIPIKGGIGAALAIIVLLGALLHDVPAIRALAIPGLLGGLLFAAALHAWRKSHPPTLRIESLQLKDDRRKS
jgi:hypothetical protein